MRNKNEKQGGFIMDTNKKDKKINVKVLLIALIILIVGVSATGIVALAARWFDQTDKTDNTVAVDQPVIVTIMGTASTTPQGTIMPGVLTSYVTTAFDISVSQPAGDTANTYNLIIKDIKFEFDASILNDLKAGGNFADEAELKAIFGDNFANLNEEDIIATAFADFVGQFNVEFDGSLNALTEGMVLIADAVTATGLTVSISANDALLLIARGGTLTFTLALAIA